MIGTDGRNRIRIVYGRLGTIHRFSVEEHDWRVESDRLKAAWRNMLDVLFERLGAGALRDVILDIGPTRPEEATAILGESGE